MPKVRGSVVIRDRFLGGFFALTLAAGSVLAAAAAAEPVPQRVVSLNLCTDQLALLIGAPGQLLTVTYLSHNPDAAVLSDRARLLPANSGLAEEVLEYRPDLVLAGTFTTRATVHLLRRTGVKVAEFDPAYSVEDIRHNLRLMGDLLGRSEQAEAEIAALDSRLAALPPVSEDQRPSLALFFANGWTAGQATLTGDAVRLAGFRNIADEIGLTGLGRLPLETLVTSAPDVVVEGRVFDPPALAQEILRHPVLERHRADGHVAHIPDKLWICGLPVIADAIAQLATIRRALTAGKDRYVSQR